MQCVFGETVYTGTSVKKDCYVCFSGKRIAAVSSRRQGTEAGRYKVITPAFIDPHNHIGMRRAGEPAAESESNEKMDAIIPLPDALDSVQMDDTSFSDAVEMGVLYSCVVPGSGNIIGGLSAVIRNYAAHSSEALIARAGVKSAFGYNPMSTESWKGTRPSTRMGALAMLRAKLHDVQQKDKRRRKAKGAKKDEIAVTAEEEILLDILSRRRRLRVHVHKADDIAALLRAADEFDLDIQVEHACDVYDTGIFRELADRGIPVTYGPVDSFAYKVELKHETWRNIGCLIESDADFGLMTDHPVSPCRQLFLQTRWFTRFGLSKQDAVEIVSFRNAKILGIDNILGSLAKRKWASFTCWNGDPFDITAYPETVYGEGRQLVSEGREQKQGR